MVSKFCWTFDIYYATSRLNSLNVMTLENQCSRKAIEGGGQFLAFPPLKNSIFVIFRAIQMYDRCQRTCYVIVVP